MIVVLPTTVTGLFDEVTTTVFPIVPGPMAVCAFALLAATSANGAINVVSRDRDIDRVRIRKSRVGISVQCT